VITACASHVSDEEVLARFVLTNSWLYKDDRPGCKVKWTALIPSPHKELSVYRIDGWTQEDVRSVGQNVADAREVNHRQREITKGNDYPDNKRTYRYLGHASLKAKSFRWVELDVSWDEPPPGHSNVIGWPTSTGNRKVDEAAQMAKALRLLETNLVSYTRCLDG
jgi:hypothetical protein